MNLKYRSKVVARERERDAHDETGMSATTPPIGAKKVLSPLAATNSGEQQSDAVKLALYEVSRANFCAPKLKMRTSRCRLRARKESHVRQAKGEHVRTKGRSKELGKRACTGGNGARVSDGQSDNVRILAQGTIRQGCNSWGRHHSSR